MNYKELVDLFEASALATSGIETFTIEYVENVNNKSSKPYMFVQIMPLEFDWFPRKQTNNNQYKIVGYCDNIPSTTIDDKVQFQTVITALKAFINLVLVNENVILINEKVNFKTIPKFENNQLMTVEFTFNIEVNEC